MAEQPTQENRPLRITTPLGKDVLLLERLDGEEFVSSLFRFKLDLLSERTDLDPASLLGKSVTIEIDFAGETRYINGIVSRFGQGPRAVRLARYRAEVVPKLWLGTLVRDNRIFQGVAVPEILTKVLRQLGVDHTAQINGQFEPRNYCVQYGETSFAYLSRLMEEEGIFYFFKHASGSHDLVLGDTSLQAATIPGATTKIPVSPDTTVPAGLTEPRIVGLDIESSMVSGKVTLWDHNFELPSNNLQASDDVEKGASEAELYDYPGEYAKRFDGVSPSGGDQASELQKILSDNTRTVELRARGAGALRTRLSGVSNYPMLIPGHKFGIDRHYRRDANREYYLISVRHVASVENYENADGAPFKYENSFSCIPADVPFAPPRVTPKARVYGSQTAVVVGPKGSEIFTDKYGRVKVQFFWDREGKKNDASSCWLRVSSPWTGKNWGMIAIPRIGSEVVVDFLEGDPDRPLITGMVYNPETMPPYKLPDNATQTGIKTRSTSGGSPETFNELRFEDKKGEEEIYLHAEKDLNAVVENNETRKVGFEKKDKGDQTVQIFNNQTIEVGAGGSNASDGSQKVDVYKDQTVTLATGDQTITLKQGNRSVTLDQGNEKIELKKGNRTVSLAVGNDELTLEKGNLTTTLKMGNASLVLNMGNAATQAKLGSISEEAMQGIEMKVGQNSIKIDQTGITIKGMMVKIEGQVQTQVKGLMTQVTADAMMTVKGAVTMIN